MNHLAPAIVLGLFACGASGGRPPDPPPEKPHAAPAAAACQDAVAHMVELQSAGSSTSPEHQRRWREHRLDVLRRACDLRPWSASYRSCLIDAADAAALSDCTTAEYERSPLRARCDALAAAMFDRTVAALERDSPEAAARYQEARADVLPAERVACAVSPWTEKELECLEAARTNDDDLACVGHHRFRRAE